MSPQPFFLCQNNSNLPRAQHITDSNIDCHEEELLASSSPCSSSLSSNIFAEKEAERVLEAFDADQNGGYCTPASPESRIPAAVQCPPAPKKPKLCRRRVLKLCSVNRRFEFAEGLGLALFIKNRCLRRRRRRTVRRCLAIAR